MIEILIVRIRESRKNEQGVSGIIELVVTMVVLGLLMPFVALGAIAIIQGSSALVSRTTAFSLQSGAMLNITQQISGAQPPPYCSYAPGSATYTSYYFITPISGCQIPSQGPPVVSQSSSIPQAIQSGSPPIPKPLSDAGASCLPSNAVSPTVSPSAIVVASPSCIGFFSYSTSGAVTVPTSLTQTITSGQSGITTIYTNPISSGIMSGSQLTISNGSNSQTVTLSSSATTGATSISVTAFNPNASYPIGATVAAPGSNSIALSAPNLVYVWVSTAPSTLNQIWETTFTPQTWSGTRNQNCDSPAATYTNPCWIQSKSSSQMIGALSASSSPNIFSYTTISGAAVLPYSGASSTCLTTSVNASQATCTTSLASIGQTSVALSFVNNGQKTTTQSINIPIKGNILTKF